jgi:hypothetical protein
MIFILCVVIAVALFVIFHTAIEIFLVSVGINLLQLGLVTYVRTHPWQTVIYVTGYFLAGAVWSVIKWWFIQTELRRQCEAVFKTQVDKSITWQEYSKVWKSRRIPDDTGFPRLIAFWPFSLVYTLLNDPVRRLCSRIYIELRGVYDRITEYVWS